MDDELKIWLRERWRRDNLDMAHTPFVFTPKTDPVLDTPEKVREFLKECDRINGFSPEIK